MSGSEPTPTLTKPRPPMLDPSVLTANKLGDDAALLSRMLLKNTS
ncbi:MAG TPA: hypothetical protein VGL29_01855 [Blastocatellia bacterium]